MLNKITVNLEHTKPRILVVDENIHSVDYLKSILEKQNYYVLSAFDGQTAVDIAVNVIPDVVLLDAELSDLSGYEICRIIRSDDRTQFIPIIILAYSKGADENTTAIKAGADDCLERPINESHLLARISSILRIKQFEKNNLKASKDLIALCADKISLIKTMIMGVTHEINNPLSAISGYAELLLSDKEPGSEEYQNLDIIKSEALRVGRNINKLLHLTEDYTDDFVIVNALDQLTLAIDIASEKAVKKGILIDFQAVDNFFETLGDSKQLTQAFYNIISNAIDFSKADQRISVKLDSDSNNIIISVSDNGIGIHEENMMRIFHPFYTTKDVGKGSGLGLSIAEGIINRHSGKIIIKSLLEHGTSIDIVLPKREVKRKIMVVEDEAVVLNQMTLILSHFGYDVFGAENAKEAIKLARENRPDLVIMDFKIPYLDGLETAKCIKSIPGLQNVILIGYTAYAFESNIKKAEEIGFNEIIVKPSDLVYIKNVISKYV